MNIRTATVVVGILDALACAATAVACFDSGSDLATIGFDYAAGAIVTTLFLVTSVPGLILVFMRRAPRAALALALTFPAVFVVLFIAAVIIFI
jgi:hypothetical protein